MIAVEDNKPLPCEMVDPELFFPLVETRESTARAKRVCRTCPYRAVCLEGAMSRDERAGVWGGLATWERDALRRGRVSDDARNCGTVDTTQYLSA